MNDPAPWDMLAWGMLGHLPHLRGLQSMIFSRGGVLLHQALQPYGEPDFC